jgi:hypothetical protein
MLIYLQYTDIHRTNIFIYRTVPVPSVGSFERRSIELHSKKQIKYLNFFYYSLINDTGIFSRTTIVALGSFLDTFQKIADAATNTKGMLYFS